MTASAADTEAKIMDLAETLIRQNGYNGFSFRDIATGVGVKSSSVHYYFPTKADLGARVAKRYTERFLDLLGDPEQPRMSAEALIAKLHREFARSLGKDGKMCLCGILAAESSGLPEAVVSEAKAFFDLTGAWLRKGLGQSDWGAGLPEADLNMQSLAILAQLEGAMLIAKVQGRPDIFGELAPPLSSN
ncbi:MAG: TetR/AcrR family transcriptional regulator [Roseibium sp.]|uniref:TetR/AcrR family transcriptional regulator n=1 Tax=Roseibium sp. TaxID=1936156 RepID=UPI003D9C457E